MKRRMSPKNSTQEADNDPRTKVYFRLQRDADGWPPVEIESMWGEQIARNKFRLDNIPFYVRGVANGDCVRVEYLQGQPWFQEVLKRSGHFTVRVLISSEANVSKVRSLFRDLGCKTEQDRIKILIAIDVPPNVAYSKVKSILEGGEKRGDWEYEEGLAPLG